MSDLALTTRQPSQAITEQPSRPKGAAITTKVRNAIAAMVWDALPRADAAAKAGMSEHGLYKALRSAHVKAHYLSELEVLRTSERARNIHRLVAIRDKSDNMPAVNAIKMLEQLGEADHHSAARVSPGLTIVVMNGAAQEPRAPNPVQVIDNAESEER